jgi:hypothetical protein
VALSMTIECSKQEQSKVKIDMDKGGETGMEGGAGVLYVSSEGEGQRPVKHLRGQSYLSLAIVMGRSGSVGHDPRST